MTYGDNLPKSPVHMYFISFLMFNSWSVIPHSAPVCSYFYLFIYFTLSCFALKDLFTYYHYSGNDWWRHFYSFIFDCFVFLFIFPLAIFCLNLTHGVDMSISIHYFVFLLSTIWWPWLTVKCQQVFPDLRQPSPLSHRYFALSSNLLRLELYLMFPPTCKWPAGWHQRSSDSKSSQFFNTLFTTQVL